jgi:hypothetical protein
MLAIRGRILLSFISHVIMHAYQKVLDQDSYFLGTHIQEGACHSHNSNHTISQGFGAEL